MVRGLPASLVFHAAIMGAGYISWPFMTANRAVETELVIVPVELLELGEMTNIAAVREIEEEPETDEIIPEEVEEPPVEDPIEEPDPVDETLPEDEIETAREAAEPEQTEPEDVLPDFDAEPEPEAEEPQAEPEPETPKAAVQDPVDPLADFLNSADSTFQSERETRKRQPEPQPAQRRLLEDTPPTPQPPRRGVGERTGNTARLEALLYAQVRGCWIGVADLPNPDRLNVRMSVTLNTDGDLMGAIDLVEPSREPVGRTPMRTAVERAKRAVRKCAPFRLPEEEYELWKDININLGPAFEAQ